jgi:hypothetical protein
MVNPSVLTTALLLQAEPLPVSAYSFFKLRKPLLITRRGKEYKFKRGDNLGWRYSSSGKFFRLISPLTGKNVVFSIPISESSLAWLLKHAPEAKKKPRIGKDAPFDLRFFKVKVVPKLRKHAIQVLHNLRVASKEMTEVRYVAVPPTRSARVLSTGTNQEFVYTPFDIAFSSPLSVETEKFRTLLTKKLNRPRWVLKVDGHSVYTKLSSQPGSNAGRSPKERYQFSYILQLEQ